MPETFPVEPHNSPNRNFVTTPWMAPHQGVVDIEHDSGAFTSRHCHAELSVPALIGPVALYTLCKQPADRLHAIRNGVDLLHFLVEGRINSPSCEVG